MDVPFYPLSRRSVALRSELTTAFHEVLDSANFISGASVAAFEDVWSRRLGAKHAIAVANGTDAIEILLVSSGVRPGDEVIVPAFTFAATLMAVANVGATPVAVDVKLDDATIDIENAAAMVTSRTTAILTVDLFGIPTLSEPLVTFANSHGLTLLVDSAQNHSEITFHGDSQYGASSASRAYSFYPTKNLGALGDAGVILTSNADVFRRALDLRTYGSAKRYEHRKLGRNSRMDEVQASFLIVLESYLSLWEHRRREIATRYMATVSDSWFVGSKLTERSWHHCVVTPPDRGVFRSKMQEKGIQTDVHYPYAAYCLPAFAAYPGLGPRSEGAFPNADQLARSVVSIPCHPWMTEAEIATVQAGLLRALPNSFGEREGEACGQHS